MIVRRFRKLSKEELSPVTVLQAAKLIAVSDAKKRKSPVSREDIKAIEADLLAGYRCLTSTITYVPDVAALTKGPTA